MSCILRVGGADFDVDEFLRTSPFEPCVVFRRGELKSPTSRPDSARLDDSSFHLDVSSAEFEDFSQQKLDALDFLKKNEAELRRLAAFPGVEGVELDFAVERHDSFVESYYLLPELLAWAGKLGISIGISCYSEST